MVMEEESECSTLLALTDSVHQQPQQDSWTSLEHQHISGKQGADTWAETEVEINQVHGMGQLSESLTEGRDFPEEVEQWEQIIWPVRPLSCASPPLSFATVQWDVPVPTAEASSLMTDSTTANELDFGGVMYVDTTSLSLHQGVDDKLLTPEGTAAEDWVDSQLLNSVLQETENDSEPCDAADVQGPAAQEKEDSAHELLDDLTEVPQGADIEAEEEHSAASDPVETADFTDILEETEGSEDEALSFVHLKLEEEQEEQEEPRILLTGQGDCEEEQLSRKGTETEEESEDGGEVEEGKSATDRGKREDDESLSSNENILVEAPQTDDAKLIDLQKSELLEERRRSETEEDTEASEQSSEDPTGENEEPEMCSDVEKNADRKQSAAVQDDLQVLTQTVANSDITEESEAGPELPVKVEETCCLQQPEHLEQLELTDDPQQTQAEVLHPAEERHSGDQSGQPQHLEQSTQMEMAEELTQPENANPPTECTPSEQTICVEAEHPGVSERREQTEPPEQKEQTATLSGTASSEQPAQPQETDESKIIEQLSAETEARQATAENEVSQVDKQAETSHRAEVVVGSDAGTDQMLVANGKGPQPPETAAPHANGSEVDRGMAQRLAERLFNLDGFQRVDVVKHLDKDNDFSRAVGEEYLKFFDFTGQTLDHALRSFLKVVVLIGETQERERVLQHFSCRFHHCNPDLFSSSGPVLSLTCALMLLNTDLHGQNVGKSMSSSKFVFNLDGMNEGENFNKDLLKSLYNSIKSEPLQWAIDEGELMSSMLLAEDKADVAPKRSKTNPFQDVPHDKKAFEVKVGLLQRKLHADVDGKRTPWGKRGWKTFSGVLKGMVLYLQKVDYRNDQPVTEEVVSVHHSLAERAADYTKKPHVFRLQTADWRVFLLQASCKVEMYSWISRINLVSALHSSPPFPAAVGSQRRFSRPILPASQCVHSLERQLQSHSGMLESFRADLTHLQKNPPEGKKAKAKDLEEHRTRAEYLHHEICRYETYIQVLEAWRSVKKTDANHLNDADLSLFDKVACAGSMGDDEEEEGLKKSHSSPALELEALPSSVVKVKRNISERRTYRRPIIPRMNKEA